MSVSGNTLSFGRPWSSAETASLTEFSDCARVDLRWADGGHIQSIHDTKAEAVAELARLGFAPSK